MRYVLPLLFTTMMSVVADAQCPGSPPAGIFCVEAGSTTDITAHSICARITNNHASGKALMIPAGSTTEWSTFRTNLAAGVTSAACGGGPPLPAVIQTAAPVYAAAGTLHTVTLSSAPTVGNVVVMLTAGRASTHVVNSVSGCGATWVKMVNRSCTNSAAEVWAGACTNAGTTITIVSNSALARVNMAQEWTNLTPLANGTSSAYISGSWTNSISIATTQAPSVVFVANGMDKVATDDTGTNSFTGAGFTGGGSNPTFTGGSFGYYIAASTGTYSTTWTAGSGGAAPNNCIVGANVY